MLIIYDVYGLESDLGLFLILLNVLVEFGSDGYVLVV